MKKVSLKSLLLLVVLLGWALLGHFNDPFAWQVPQSNQFTKSYPHLSYKIFLAVMEPWFEPETKKTLLELPERPAEEPNRTSAA